MLKLSYNLCTLFFLLTAQRGQNLHLLEIGKDERVIIPRHLLKQSRSGHHEENIILRAFRKNRQLCIVDIMQEYLKKTENMRTDDKLLQSTVKPYKAVWRSTVSRWVKLYNVKSRCRWFF